jgi:hypothetical protein
MGRLGEVAERIQKATSHLTLVVVPGRAPEHNGLDPLIWGDAFSPGLQASGLGLELGSIDPTRRPPTHMCRTVSSFLCCPIVGSLARPLHLPFFLGPSFASSFSSPLSAQYCTVLKTRGESCTCFLSGISPAFWSLVVCFSMLPRMYEQPSVADIRTHTHTHTLSLSLSLSVNSRPNRPSFKARRSELHGQLATSVRRGCIRSWQRSWRVVQSSLVV